MKWWMTALTAVSVMGVLLLPGVRRHEPAVDASTWPTNEALTVRPAPATIEPAKTLEANENLVVVSRPAILKPVVNAEPASAAATAPASTAATPAAIASAPASEPAVAPTIVDARPVTITGCLDVDHDRLLLKDTAGTAAPKSRSWKSGFLKKGSASIELIEPTHVLKLATYDGQRVSVSGTLDDRELHVHSVQRVDRSCR